MIKKLFIFCLTSVSFGLQSSPITHTLIYNVSSGVTCAVGDTLKLYGTYAGDYTAASLSGTTNIGNIYPTMVSSSPFYVGYLVVQGSETRILFSELSQGQKQIDVTVLSTTGFEELIKTDKLLFYPNPAKNFVIVKSDQLSRLELHSPDGKVLLSQSLEIGDTSIDLSTYKSGIYFIKTKKHFFKIIKE